MTMEIQAAELGAGMAEIVEIAAGAAIARYAWADRGVAPAGYIKGMAVTYARVYGKLKAGDAAAQEMARANSGNAAKDALAWYGEWFRELGMDNSKDGVDTLRHLFVLLTGVGMRESSGRYCEGRDRSAANCTAETAEAGAFQTSYNARVASPVMIGLFEQYLNAPSGFVRIFGEGVTGRYADFENYGSGPGEEFQRLSKGCPAFAAEFAALGMRHLRTHWGTINTHAAEVRVECNEMFLRVQEAVDAKGLCPI